LLLSLKRARQSTVGVLVGLALLAMMCVVSAGAVYAVPCVTVGDNSTGDGQCGPTDPSPGATPELDSLFLFGTGIAGVASYAALRLRARR
jgi:hypothetical protein